METPDDDDTSLTRAARFLRATPAELIGLTVLLTGSLAASGALWWSALQRPEAPVAPLVEVGAGGSDEVRDHPPLAAPEAAADAPPAPVTVHVTGAVRAPGIVILPSGARVGDAVAAAGGLSVAADLDRINLARPVADGEHVHALRAGEDPPIAGADSRPFAPPSAEAMTSEGRIDINRASVEHLQTLPGIGPAKASAIVRHREEHGPFQVAGDLRGVPGIGEATFQGLAELIDAG